MATYTQTEGVSGVLPGEWGSLLVGPVQAAATALNPAVSTIITTESHDFHLPVLDSDAAASWVAEGAEITPSDPTLREITITPAKVAGLAVISRELANDTSPQAQQIVGDSLARAIALKIDQAFFGAVASPAPSGLGSFVNGDVNRVALGTAPANLDGFAKAQSLVEQTGAQITAWVGNPADVLTVQQLKTQTGSAQPLLGTDASNGTARTVFGVPVLSTPNTAAGNVWGLSAARCIVVIREDVTVESDASVFFTSDRIAVKAVMRVGFAFPVPKAVAKLALAAS